MKYLLPLLLFIPSVAYSQEPTDYAKLAIAQQVAKNAIDHYTPVSTTAPTTSSLSTTPKQLERQPTEVANCEPVQQNTTVANCSTTRTAPLNCNQEVNYVPMAQQTVPFNCSTGQQVQGTYWSNQANCTSQATTYAEAACGATQRVGFFRRLLRR